MSQYFCIHMEFLNGRFHGRGEGGEPEWPPSPLRLFQALTAACAGHHNERVEIHACADDLRWLESQPAPRILAPSARTAQPYRLYVPNNTGDLAAASWASHREKDLSAFRTEKDIHPLVIDEGAKLYYLWKFEAPTADDKAHAKALIEAAAAITHLGWGIDQAAAQALWLDEDEAAELPGEAYEPADTATGRKLPVPVPGTLAALSQRHGATLGRLKTQGRAQLFQPVPRLTTLRWADYQHEGSPQARVSRLFALAPVPESETMARFQAYDPICQTTCVTAMIRRLLASDAFQQKLGWSADKLVMLHGHGEAKGESVHRPVAGPRLAILPLPSNEYRGGKQGHTFGSIRRVLLTIVRGQDDEALDDVCHLLSGCVLEPEETSTVRALLQPIPLDGMTEKNYLRPSANWATVTPVVLPGHEDPGGLRRKLNRGRKMLSAEVKNALVEKLDARVDALLRKAIRQAGYSETMARNALITWRGTGFFPGVGLSYRYFVPKHLQGYRKYHVRISWCDGNGLPLAIPGPLALGGGRFTGIGLFASDNTLHDTM